MTTDQSKLKLFLNNLEGEVVAIIPNVTPFPANYVNFLLAIIFILVAACGNVEPTAMPIPPTEIPIISTAFSASPSSPTNQNR